MNKVVSYMFTVLLFSFVSVIGMTFFIINYGAMNDYVFVPLQDLSDNLASSGFLSSTYNALTLTIGETYQEVITYGDSIWFSVYVLFIVSSLVYAYGLRGNSEINIFQVLLYGMILLMYIGSIYEIITNWFLINITANLIPNVLEYFPKFNWYISNLGVINLIHATVLLFLGKINLNMSKQRLEDKSEIESMDNEVYI